MAAETERGAESNVAAIWRAIGRLEGDTAALLEGQHSLREGQRDLGRRADDLGRRVDRLFYAILGMGGALLAAILATHFFEG